MGAEKDGGSAFPFSCVEVDTGKEHRSTFGTGLNVHRMEPGMSLRDWFAGQALNGILSGDYRSCCEKKTVEKLAAECGGIADAMLKEREKGAGEMSTKIKESGVYSSVVFR